VTLYNLTLSAEGVSPRWLATVNDLDFALSERATWANREHVPVEQIAIAEVEYEPMVAQPSVPWHPRYSHGEAAA
jgi:hypothetical protein